MNSISYCSLWMAFKMYWWPQAPLMAEQSCDRRVFLFVTDVFAKLTFASKASNGSRDDAHRVLVVRLRQKRQAHKARKKPI